MVVVRGVNLFPDAIENLVRRIETVADYQINVTRGTDLARLEVSIEVAEGADAEATREAVAKSVQTALSLNPEVTVVPAESLPRFELKARRFHVTD